MSWTWDKLAWIDVETTGTDPERDLLLEVGCIITTGQLREIDRRQLVIRWPAAKMEPALDREDRDEDTNYFLRRMHTDNGLLVECQGEHAVSLAEADEEIRFLIAQHCGGSDPRRLTTLAGCSPWIDRSMVRLYFPETYELIAHRTLDCSTLKAAQVNWGDPDLLPSAKKYEHRAIPDLEASIRRARKVRGWYRRAAKLMRADDERRATKRETKKGRLTPAKVSA